MARKDYEKEAIEAGFRDTDSLNGYLSGRRGESIISRPEHLTENRRERWSIGFFAGKDARTADRKGKHVVVVWHDPATDSAEATVLKGWTVDRGAYLSRLQKRGVGGDVDFIYYNGEDKVRTHPCGI